MGRERGVMRRADRLPHREKLCMGANFGLKVVCRRACCSKWWHWGVLGDRVKGRL